MDTTKRYRTVTFDGVGEYDTYAEASRNISGENWAIWGVIPSNGKVFIISQSAQQTPTKEL